VNGFLIDAVAHGVRSFKWSGEQHAALTDANLAEIIVRTYKQRRFYAGLSLMVWILKREVRAFGGCLGMYRR
jgi:hypothetical protein